MTEAGGVIVGVDVGGTKLLAGVVDSRGIVRHNVLRSTPGRHATTRVLEDELVTGVLEAAQEAPLAGVGIAAAGFVETTGDRVMFAPHLSWRDAPVRTRLEARLGCPVVLDNDANCAALAEWTFGAGRGTASMLMITLGTGIGGGMVLDGRVVRGANGMAGEFGHMQVVPDGHPCECGGRGCWEQYCSGSALIRFARERLGHDPTILEELCTGRPELLTGQMIAAAADEGDLVAQQAFHSVGEWLGRGVANLAAALDPQVVVVGGGVSTVGERILRTGRATLERTLVGGMFRVPPTLLPARLGTQAGLVGAAIRARGSAD